MNERKICPLLFASAADIEYECRPDRCAWWNNSVGACAIAAGSAAMLSIGNSLKEIADSLEEIADQEDEL